MAILRVLTFNVRVNSPKDGLNAWPARADRAAAIIGQARPDVIGFQEMQPVHWEAFATRLPAYGRSAGPQVDNQEPFARPAIFWNVDRLHLIRRGGFYLSQTPATFSRDWESAYTRGAGWVQLRLNAFSSQPILFLNAHLDNKSEAARQHQAAVLLAQADRLQTAGQAAVITGDFNCDPGSPTHSTLTQGGFRDSFAEVPPPASQPIGTFHNYTGQATHRIDWILTRPGNLKITTLACEILTAAEPPLYPSDHFPVLTTFQLEH